MHTCTNIETSIFSCIYICILDNTNNINIRL